MVIKTNGNEVHTRAVVNCAGLGCDLIAKMTASTGGLRIIPFRGEYYELAPRSRHLVRGLIYPVPDPRFPFLGVHFTKKIGGSVEAGPNAVLAFAREGTKRPLNWFYWAWLPFRLLADGDPLLEDGPRVLPVVG